MRKSRRIICYSLFFSLFISTYSNAASLQQIKSAASSISSGCSKIKNIVMQFPSRLNTKFNQSTVTVKGKKLNSFEDLDKVSLVGPVKIGSRKVPAGIILPLGEKGIGDPNKGFSSRVKVQTRPTIIDLIPDKLKSAFKLFKWSKLSVVDLLLGNVSNYLGMPSAIKDKITPIQKAIKDAGVSGKVKPLLTLDGMKIFLIKCSLAVASYKDQKDKLSFTLAALLGKLLRTQKPKGGYYTLDDLFGKAVKLPALIRSILNKVKAQLNTVRRYWEAPAPGQEGFVPYTTLSKTETEKELLKLLIWTYKTTNSYAKKLNKTAKWVFNNHSITIKNQQVKIKDIVAAWVVLIMKHSKSSANLFNSINDLLIELLGMDLTALTSYAEEEGIDDNYFDEFEDSDWSDFEEEW